MARELSHIRRCCWRSAAVSVKVRLVSVSLMFKELRFDLFCTHLVSGSSNTCSYQWTPRCGVGRRAWRSATCFTSVSCRTSSTCRTASQALQLFSAWIPMVGSISSIGVQQLLTIHRVVFAWTAEWVSLQLHLRGKAWRGSTLLSRLEAGELYLLQPRCASMCHSLCRRCLNAGFASLHAGLQVLRLQHQQGPRSTLQDAGSAQCCAERRR